MRNKKVKVSIILPNYNSSEFVEKTIQSVIKQSFKNWELLVVDDCSNEKTKKILRKYEKIKKIKIYWLKKNRGAAFCRNFALKKIKSDFVAFIDSDDFWKKNKLKKQINFMVRNNYNFTYTYYKTFGYKTSLIRPPEKLSFLEFVKNTSIATSSMILKRKILKGIKFTNTLICEDYYFKCSALQKISAAHCLKSFETHYRLRKNSMQSNNFKNLYWIWKINKDYNNFNFLKNFNSVLNISLSSFKRYGLK